MSPQRYDLSDYKEVSERIVDLRQKYPDASLSSEVILWPTAELPFIAVKALCYRSRKDENPGVGLAWEPFPGKTPYTRDSELQNAETSAWGRAIVAALASDTKQGIASADEVRARRDSEPSSSSARQGSEQGAAPQSNTPPGPSPTTSGDGTSIRGGASPDAAEGSANAYGEGAAADPKVAQHVLELYGGKAHALRAARMFHDFTSFDAIDAETLQLLIDKKLNPAGASA